MMDCKEQPSGLVIVVDTASVATPPARTKPEYLDRCPACGSDQVDQFCRTGAYELHCGTCGYQSPELHGPGGIVLGPLGMARYRPERILLDWVGPGDGRFCVRSSDPDACWQVGPERLRCTINRLDLVGSVATARARAAAILRVRPEDITVSARFRLPDRS